MWYGWVVVVAVITIVGTTAFHRSFPANAGTVVGTVYTQSVFIGIPTAAVAFVATRMQRRVPARSWVVQYMLALLAFFGAIPVALVVGAVSDVVVRKEAVS